MVKRFTARVRVELLLLIAACASALAMGMPREAHADGGCTSTCSAAFGSSYTSGGRLWILTDCAVSESGTTFCQYTGKALLPSIG
jgi:hypothetical protein